MVRKNTERAFGQLWSGSCHSSKTELETSNTVLEQLTHCPSKSLEEASRKPVLHTVKKKELSGVSNPSRYIYHQVPHSGACWVWGILISCTMRIPSSAENLVSKGRKNEMLGDVKAVLHKGDKDCLLLGSGLLQSDRSINPSVAVLILYLLICSCSSWYPHTWPWMPVA